MSAIKEFLWERPEAIEFPRIWCKFQAHNADTDEPIEYRIQDLPESRFQDGADFMAQHFCSDEPISKALELANDMDAIDDFKRLWNLTFKQKMTIACFKNGSDEIIAMNANYIKSKGETTMEEAHKNIKTDKLRKFGELMHLLHDNCDTFEMYGADKYLTAVGLVVDAKYRGRGIAEHILRARKLICNEFGIKVTSSVFTSDAANRIADKVGFKLDKIMRYDDVGITHPHLKLPIQSNAMTIKSILYESVFKISVNQT